MTALTIGALRLHPLKGARAEAVSSAVIGPLGLDGDRRFLATDAEGAFLTQRDRPALARVNARWRDGRLQLSAQGAGAFEAAPDGSAERCKVRVWSDMVSPLAMGPDADSWLTRALGCPARVFFMDEHCLRRTSARFAPAAPTSFADAFPILVTSSASLAALNAEISKNGGAPVGMERFRPNIVIDGADPWAEDYWAAIEIGEVIVDLVKPCDRCLVTTTDQLTGARLGKEPLASLARLRLSADPRVSGVLFGWNALVRRPGTIKVGDGARVLERRDDGWPIAAQAGVQPTP